MTDPAQPPSPSRAGIAPFVGRDRELTRLLRAVDDAVDQRGGLVLISGEPGIGKSRLADQVAMRARDSDVRVLVGRCWDGAGAPAFWPWIQVIRSLVRSTDAAVLRRQLGSGAGDVAQMAPELRELFGELRPAGATESDSARFQLFDSAARFLRAAAAEGPLLVVIDDLHAADLPSLLFLRFLADQLEGAAILVVGTYRDAEFADADEPTRQALADMLRMPSTTVVTLAGLGEPLVGELIQATANVPPPPSLVSAIVRETGGNPLFVGEAVRLLEAEGRLGEIGTGQSLDLPIPHAIRDVITRRVRHLEPATLDALRHAAAIGPELSVEVLRRAMGSPDDLLDRLHAGVRAGLIVSVPGALGRYRFTHDLIRTTLYDELGAGARVRLHRRIAETLEELYASTPEAYRAELAHHFSEASRGGGSEADEAGRRAADYAREAGDLAIRSLAYEEAARLYRMALAALDAAAPAELAQRADTLIRLGDAEARAGDLPAARVTFLKAAESAQRTGDADALARAVLGYGGRFFYVRVGHDPHLIPLLQEALVMRGATEDLLRVRLLTRLACAWRSSPERLEQRRALSQQAIDMARGMGDRTALGYALGGHYWAVWLPDNPDERLEIATEMLSVAETMGDAERLIDAHMMLVLVHMDVGRIREARAGIDIAINLAKELRQPAQLWLTRATTTVLALMEGDLAAAERSIPHEIAPGLPTTLNQDDVSAVRMHRFLLRREQGRLEEEEESVRASAEEFPWYPLHRAALVLLLHDLGRIEEARAILSELAADGFRALYQDCEWLLGVGLAAEACHLLNDAAAAASLYPQLVPHAGMNAIGHPEGSIGIVDRYLGLLAATMGRDDDAVRHLEEAIDGNRRMGAVAWVAHSQADLAAALRRRGRDGDARRASDLERAAMETARRLGMTSLASAVLGGRPGPADAEVDAGPATAATFRREGEYWNLEYAASAVRVRDAKGMGYLARLLASPGHELHAVDLAAGASAGAERIDPGTLLSVSALDGTGPLLDAEAKLAYRRRLDELDEERSEAERWNDAERAARRQAEIDALIGELTAAVGLGGRDRQANAPAERARIAVTRAIRSAMARISRQSPELGAHLEATIRTGAFCVYVPDPRVPIDWSL